MTYRVTSLVAAFICFTLGILLILVPDFIYWLFSLSGNDLGNFLARRAAMLFFGFATLCYLSRNAPDSALRRSIAAAVAVAMAGLALSGLFEFFRGYVGAGIWLAIVTEIGFALLFVRFAKHS